MVKNDDDVDEDQMGEERTHPWSTHHISLSNLNFFTHQSRQIFWPCHQNGLRTFADFVWRSSQIGEFCGSGTLGLSNKTLEKMWKRKVK